MTSEKTNKMLELEFDCKKCKNAEICKASNLGSFQEYREVQTFFKYYPFLDMTIEKFLRKRKKNPSRL